MKHLLTILIFALFFSYVQGQDSTYIISKVVQVDSTTKDELYSRAKLWVATSFKSAKSVIDLEDKENGTLVIKGLFTVTSAAGYAYRREQGYVKYILTIQCKDNRFKYSINEFIHSGNVGYGSGGFLSNEKPDCGTSLIPNAGWKDMKGQSIDYIKRLESSLLSGMNKKDNTQKDDW